MGLIQTLGSILGLGLVSGIRLYLAVLTLGLGVRFEYFHLSPKLSYLAVLADDRVLIGAGVGCIIEFCADKIPWVDSLWDSLQIFLRPAGAAIIGSLAIGRTNSVVKLAAILLCCGAALAAHAAKAAGRLAVNHSRKPLGNLGLSLAEDFIAPVGVWLSLEFPFVMLNVAAIFFVLFAGSAYMILRLVKLELLATMNLLRGLVPGKRRLQDPVLPSAAAAKLGSVARTLKESALPLPERYWRLLEPRSLVNENPLSIHCAAVNVQELRNSVGFLFFSEQAVFFVTNRRFRLRLHEIGLDRIEGVTLKRGILMDRLTFHTQQGDRDFAAFKQRRTAAPVRANASESFAGRL